jgi:hypothetical protein
MINRFASLFIALLLSVHASADIDCDLLIGSRSGTFYSDDLEAQNKFELTFRKNGSFTQRLIYAYYDGASIQAVTQHADWTCENGVYYLEFKGTASMFRSGPDKAYQINELNHAYANISVIIGDPIGEVYELNRM